MMTPSVPRTPSVTEAPTEPGEPRTEPAPTARDSEAFLVARGSTPELESTEYRLGAVIGRGGMGEVLIAHDMRIGRDVAVKRMRSRSPSESEIDRFVREARIQARLDHPAIVPVHEVGLDRDGKPYFTMRRLTGTNLHDLLRTRAVSQQRLLRAFADVCLALDYAHARGVIHRDLKPANIMLGDFGEVYVLDWGVARCVDEETNDTDDEHRGRMTEVGAILGTPGYIAPEQLVGAPAGTAADVYSLGAILFEILTGEPLHPVDDAYASTLDRSCVAPTMRTPLRAIAPELDVACVAALAGVAALRLSARQLADRIQRYLDGDRDVERRCALAAEQLAIARMSLANDPVAGRAEAMRIAGRALALDPDSTAAADLVTSLMLEPPAELPAELVERIAGADADIMRQQARVAKLALLAFFPFVPMLAVMGINDLTAVAAVFGSVGLAILGLWLLAWRLHPRAFVIAPLLGAVVIIACERAIGPFFIVPGLIATITVALVSFPQLIDRPRFVIGAMIASFLIPVTLELTGVLHGTWELVEGGVLSKSPSVDVTGALGTLFLILTHVAMILVIGFYARALALSRRDFQRKLEIQAWHLGQLLPRRPQIAKGSQQ
jgi:serine/threonine protein kinase